MAELGHADLLTFRRGFMQRLIILSWKPRLAGILIRQIFAINLRARALVSIVVFSLHFVASYDSADAALLLEYTFDDQLDPTANSGTLGASWNGDLQGNTSFAPSDTSFAASFDGATSNNSVVVPLGGESVFDIGDGDFSLYARFQTSFSDVSASRLRALIWKQETGSNPTYALGVRQENGLAQLLVADGTQSVLVFSTQPVNDGLWHEALGVRHGNELCLFIDGVFNAMTTLPANFGSTNNNEPLIIGGRTLGGTDDWQGLIDEIQVYDEAIQTCIPEPACTLLAFTALAYLLLARITLRRQYS
jgi:hypothetical protein